MIILLIVIGLLLVFVGSALASGLRLRWVRRQERKPGCCSCCDGTGYSGDESTGGMCWDCRATGHAHGPMPWRWKLRSLLTRGDNCWTVR